MHVCVWSIVGLDNFKEAMDRITPMLSRSPNRVQAKKAVL